MNFAGSCRQGVDGPAEEGGTKVAADNVMSYTNIMADYYDDAYRIWDDEARVPYLSFTSPTGPEGCTFISYDAPESIRCKGDYLHDEGLGGATIWTVNQGALGDGNPLLTALGEAVPGQP